MKCKECNTKLIVISRKPVSLYCETCDAYSDEKGGYLPRVNKRTTTEAKVLNDLYDQYEDLRKESH